MSLFPAFSENKQDINAPLNDTTWLINESFKPENLSLLNQPSNYSENTHELIPESSSKNDICKEKISNKKKKRKDKNEQPDTSKKTKTKPTKSIKDDLINFNNDEFSIEVRPNKQFKEIPYIPIPETPKYYARNIGLGIKTEKKVMKNKKIKRYYSKKIENNEESSMKTSVKNEIDIDNEESEVKKWTGSKLEKDLSNTTAFFNRSLTEDPTNISMWLNYVQFQDNMWQFEKSYRRGSLAKGARVTAERKLLILDKALTHNPECEELLRERLLILERVYPADEMSVMVKKLVDNEPENVILWQAYIESTQCSMAHCNTEAVIKMYNQCLLKLHRLRRSVTTERNNVESKIINMLYRCGLFLRQTGLWEQLWTLLRMYLELNFSNENNRIFFKYELSLDDKQLMDLEEIILNSNLPSHELWLRIEKLREACHWLPWNSTEPCEDPQRMVFSDDVSELIHPITTPENNFRLAAIILSLLKIPLLPCRHSTMNLLGLDYVPWALDAVEVLLPLVYHNSTLNISSAFLLKDLIMFAVGPQFLKTHPGQEEYLEFVTKIFRNCANSLDGSYRTALYVWWFSFEKLLLILDKEGLIKLPGDHKRKIKSLIKDILKQDENRNNLIFYREYALIENEQNNFEKAVKTITTAMTIKFNQVAVINVSNIDERSALCSLYRTLVEMFIKKTDNQNENRNVTINTLISLALGIPVSVHNTIVTNNMVEKALLKFKEITNELLLEEKCKLTIADYFLPNFFTDWIICNGWLIYFTKSVWDAASFIEDIFNNHSQLDAYRHEILFEWYVSIVHKHCFENKGSANYNNLYEVLERSLKLFPNNLYLLATIAQIENISGCLTRPRWKLYNSLIESNHALPALFLILLVKQRIQELKKAQDNSQNEIGGPALEDAASKNRMLSLFSKLTTTNSVSKRCGLIWRLYLQFLYQKTTADKCRNTYYIACEECPWLKALYMDAAVYIPTELPQIQDLLIEKQLRLHLTPEELDVLKN